MDDDTVVILEGAEADATTDTDVVELRDDDAPTLPAAAQRQSDGTYILPLATPVTLKFRRQGSDQVREERVLQLHLHRLTGADMRAISSAGTNAGVVAIARSARIDTGRFNAIFDRMDGADAHAASQVVDFLLRPGRPTGQ